MMMMKKQVMMMNGGEDNYNTSESGIGVEMSIVAVNIPIDPPGVIGAVGDDRCSRRCAVLLSASHRDGVCSGGRLLLS